MTDDRFALAERARAVMAEMGVHDLTDADWADVADVGNLTAAGRYVGSATTCVYCHNPISSGEPRRLLAVPDLPARYQQFHEPCAVQFAAGWEKRR